MSLVRVWWPTANYSSRGGSGVDLIVAHNTEGAQTYQSLGDFFEGNVGASSHVGIDNHVRGTIGEYVSRGNSAWTACNANKKCIQAEQCTPSGASANWTYEHWMATQQTLLHNTADWIREEASKFGIPIVRLSASQAQSGSRGICQHSDLGSWGTGHSDCGKGYPINDVIAWAKGGIPDELEEDDMTPGFAWWTNPSTKEKHLYRSCRGADGRIYYAGPDTNDVWTMVDVNSQSISGTTMAIADDGTTAIGYINTSHDVCTYIRNPGDWKWGWVNNGGNVLSWQTPRI